MDFPLTATDARGRTVTLDAAPRRIVSLVPSQTELLADLGLDAEVVGVTRFCVHPPHWKEEKTIVGGTKNVNLDRVADLAPDLVLANLEENVRADVEALDALAPAWVTDIATVDDALGMIRTVGDLTGTAGRADGLAAEIEYSFGAFSDRPLIRVAYLIWRDPWMTVGGDTFIHDVLARASFANVFGDRTRYPEVSAHDLVAAAPDVVLLSSEPFPFGERHIAEIERVLPGVPVALIDGELCSWYGSRMRLAPPYLDGLRDTLLAELGR